MLEYAVLQLSSSRTKSRVLLGWNSCRVSVRKRASLAWRVKLPEEQLLTLVNSQTRNFSHGPHGSRCKSHHLAKSVATLASGKSTAHTSLTKDNLFLFGYKCSLGPRARPESTEEKAREGENPTITDEHSSPLTPDSLPSTGWFWIHFP